ncbi:hydroxymethylbilane synthase [Candidatus Marinamargulisbacteria bacterium SCGC AAA071-K20]|nr:hydroxymethylbilane synthase [Candidatus Marinamargulisbacteria bacterium SCGC AAA071-K20]
MIKLGTRKSPLALIQADLVKAQLLRANPSLDIEIVPILTSGDRDKISPLSEIGGKGVFIKTLETALLDNTIDIAIHSLKDVTSELEKGLELSSFLSPEAIEDCIVFNSKYKTNTLEELPINAKIGTGSLRRKVLISQTIPTAQFIEIRGNVETRLQKLESENIDAIVLSYCGLIRLGLQKKANLILDPEEFIPAPGQGVIALETRKNDKQNKKNALLINSSTQEKISRLELAFLSEIGLDCGYPLGLYTTFENKKFNCIIFLATEDGELQYEEEIKVDEKDAHNLLISKAIAYKSLLKNENPND